MDLTYLTDHLFDLLNESDILNITQIIPTPTKDGFEFVTEDGSSFSIICYKSSGGTD